MDDISKKRKEKILYDDDEDSGAYSEKRDNVIQIEEPDEEEDEQIALTPVVKVSNLSPIRVSNKEMNKLRTPIKKKSSTKDEENPVILPVRSPVFRKQMQNESYENAKYEEIQERKKKFEEKKKEEEEEEEINKNEEEYVNRTNQVRRQIDDSEIKESLEKRKKKIEKIEDEEETLTDEEEERIIRHRKRDLLQQKREKRLRESETPLQTAIRMTGNENPRYNDIKDNESIVDECYRELESMYNRILKNKKLVKKYPNLNEILDFSRDKSLKDLHDEYYDAIRSIYADKKSGNYQVWYELGTMAFEYFCIRILGPQASGMARFLLGRKSKVRKFFKEYFSEKFSYGTSSGDSEKDIYKSFIYDLILALIIFFLTSLLAKQFGLGDETKQEAAKYFDKQMTSNVNVSTIVSGEILSETSEVIDEEESILMKILKSSGLSGLGNMGKKQQNTSTNKPTFNFDF